MQTHRLNVSVHIRIGCYSGLRLLPGEALQSRLEDLQLRLAESLLKEPPYELRKLGRFWDGMGEKYQVCWGRWGLTVSQSALKWLSDKPPLPPLTWLTLHCLLLHIYTQDMVLAAITDPSQRLPPELAACMDQDVLDLVLALRGLLAFGVLWQALQRRHNVDYGVDRWAAGDAT